MLTAPSIWDVELAGLITLFATCAIVGVGSLYRHCGTNIERHVQIALGEQAADFDEPTRADIEADNYWLNWATDTPLYNATAAHIAHHAADEIDAEWADLQRRIGEAS